MNGTDTMRQSNSPNTAGIGVPAEGVRVRTWRVGSLSMGIALMLIGTAFAVSLWQETEAYEMLMWIAPIIFILLGAELLIHLKMTGNRNTIVRYDWISIFFVGVMGMGSIVLASVMSTGLFDELKQGFNMTERTAFVETEKLSVPAEVTKVVVQSSGGEKIEKADAREVQVLGQILYRSVEPASNVSDSIMKTSIVGSTMYIMIGSMEHSTNEFRSDYVRSRLIVVLPQDVVVEQWN
ncbi:hypothetical protein [Paenibacillus sp. L3-i20]|uniref:hypothetical protein n=1 Tax=Paenibacillus sp. L3-i20 TaxID=2905833 RepID=UPI001EE0B23B|nr:hypothetical protein [Paenibacillus sp. L3-i20]GKU77691.1 hypothetical protein L3i20_v220880 [Paenibacillus sp. L3-i20]